MSSHITDTGWLEFTAFSDAGGGHEAWSNVTYARREDTDYATCSSQQSGYSSNYHRSLSMSRLMPSNADIKGIEIKARVKAGTGATVDLKYIQMVIAGSLAGDNKGASGWDTMPDNNTFAWYSYGSATDLWGLGSLTAAQANASNFGFSFGGQFAAFDEQTGVISLDAVLIKLHYHSNSDMFLAHP